jgi:hypothetical protein
VIRHVILVVAAVAGLWVLSQWWFPGDEAQIRAVLDRIAAGISAEASDSQVGRAARVAALADAFDPEVIVSAGPPFSKVVGRDMVLGTAARMNATIRNLEIAFRDVQVTVADDHSQATVMLTAEARFDEGSGGRGLEARELQVTLRPTDDGWVVARAVLRETLQPVHPQQ